MNFVKKRFLLLKSPQPQIKNKSIEEDEGFCIFVICRLEHKFLHWEEFDTILFDLEISGCFCIRFWEENLCDKRLWLVAGTIKPPRLVIIKSYKTCLCYAFFCWFLNLFAGDVDRNREQQENLGSAYQQDQRVQPCHLSSSIYYGGPDVYFQPQNSSINSKVI